MGNDLLDTIISSKTDPIPLGTYIFSSGGRDQFPAEDWINPAEGLTYPVEKYPELAAAKPNWISGGGVTDCYPG